MLLCLCGEYGLRTLYTFMIWGSSPHMRGILLIRKRYRRTSWFTPAHAGNTYIDVKMIEWRKVHPRPCGEYPFWIHHFNPYAGSPPPMRGILHQGSRQA